MVGPATATRIAVKIFIEQNQIPPMGIFGVEIVVSMAGPFAIFVGQENPGQALRKFVRHLAKIFQGA